MITSEKIMRYNINGVLVRVPPGLLKFKRQKVKMLKNNEIEFFIHL